MITHDNIDLPDLPPCFEVLTDRTHSEIRAYALAAIKADRKRRGVPVGITSIVDMSRILKEHYIEEVRRTDCAILYTVTFDQLRAIYDRGRREAPQPAEPSNGEPVASIYITESGEREFDDWRVPLPVGSTELFAAPQPAENSVNLEVAIQAISALHNNDTDWDTSYWNQAVGRCVSELNKLRSQQPDEPVKTDSAGYTLGPISDGGMDPRDRTTLNDPIETSIRRFELLAADRNHGAVDPLVGAQELRAYKDSLAPQPAEPVSVTERWQDGDDSNMVSRVAEPVKVPSDADIDGVWRELTGRPCIPGSTAHAFARALLARYGNKEQT